MKTISATTECTTFADGRVVSSLMDEDVGLVTKQTRSENAPVLSSSKVELSSLKSSPLPYFTLPFPQNPITLDELPFLCEASHLSRSTIISCDTFPLSVSET